MNEEQLKEFLKKNLKVKVEMGRWNSGMCMREMKVELHLTKADSDGFIEFNEQTIISSDVEYYDEK